MKVTRTERKSERRLSLRENGGGGLASPDINTRVGAVGRKWSSVRAVARGGGGTKIIGIEYARSGKGPKKKHGKPEWGPSRKPKLRYPMENGLVNYSRGPTMGVVTKRGLDPVSAASYMGKLKVGHD